MSKQQIFSLLLLIISILIGIISEMSISVRIYLGLALGYVLVRGAFGFAGSINRAYRYNSLKLMDALMNMFVVTSVLVAVLILVTGIDNYNLWINQINAGLIIGGVLFGIGMAFASCCASGVMTDGVTNPIKLIIVTSGFGLGILLGFPLQTSATWITDGYTLAFFDLVNNLYLGVIIAVMLTIALAYIVKVIIKKIEEKWEEQGKKPCCSAELDQGVYEDGLAKTLKKPFTLNQSAIIISVIFVIMMALTKEGWGASTPYGFWVGKLLINFGMNPNTLAEFTNKGTEFFTVGLFSGQGPSSVGIQNIFIFIGGIIAALSMERFKPSFKVNPKIMTLLFIGGLTMGFGTRLANGCNVGALYTPIANFSLSGWIFLIVMTVGGVIGNTLYKRLFKVT